MIQGEGLRLPTSQWEECQRVCTCFKGARLTQLCGLCLTNAEVIKAIAGREQCISLHSLKGILQGIPHLLENSILGLKVPSRNDSGFLCWGLMLQANLGTVQQNVLAEFSHGYPSL